jgi:hypothetical protein
MKYNFYHNNRSINKDNKTKHYPHTSEESSKKLNVDINKLLNRVKNDMYQEKKSKIVFFSLVTSLIVLLGVLISVAR